MNTENLIKNVRDFFSSQYNKSLPNSKTFVSFEPLAHSLLPEEYKVAGQFDTLLGNQQLARLCDKVPEIGELFITDGLSPLSEKYVDLKNSIVFTNKKITGDDKPYAEKFLTVKAKAEQLIKDQPLASILPGEDANAKLYTCTGSPAGWYNPDSNIWSHTIIKQSDVQVTTGASHPPPLQGTKIETANLAWKMNASAQKFINNQSFKAALYNHAFLLKTDLPKLNQKAVLASSLQLTMADTAVHAALPAAAAKAAITSAGASMLETNTAFLKSNQLSVINKQLYMDFQSSVPFYQMAKVNRILGRSANTESVEVKSNNFVMDFSYVLVNIERSWLYPALFDEGYTKLWYALAQKTGSYSTGDNASSNNGTLRAIPKAMIVIKDLVITATWNEEDKKYQSGSYGLGSFNISRSHFSADGKNLINPGIQILGWVCEVLPKLPVNDDENIH